MQVMMTLVQVLQLLSALCMIGLVLVQHGKGADMGASFGSGASGSLFGATGSANFLSRSTAVCATLFFVCTLTLAYMASHRDAIPASDSLIDRSAPAAAVAPSAVASGAAAIPGAAPAVVTPAASK
ncbi:MAG: preprotein translocase subunit SecG [Burkholderiaceae bacterium]|nr:preprotein translocase subunit SecG [Roseateles sp.]MBV8468739.1 preprotein translocase subunit SecG [Burkholderiaceae bacterium]